MEPWDALDENDRLGLAGYINLYGNVDLRGYPDAVEHVFGYWNMNKRDLFHKLFGEKLRMEIPIDVKPPYEETQTNLMKVYKVPYVYDGDDGILQYMEMHSDDRVFNEFVFDVFAYMYSLQTSGVYSVESVRDIANAFREAIRYPNVISNSTKFEAKYKYYCENEQKWKTAVIHVGSKAIKAVRTMLSNIGYPHMEKFNKWKDEVSVATTVRERNDVSLVLSIHPIDYMTMSDNDCGWGSCMNWNGGDFSAGTIEMMNSSCVIVGYLQSLQKPYMDRCGYMIPNKSWRCLFYVTKSMIFSGKSYPYRNNELCRIAVEKIKDMVNAIGENHYGSVTQYDDMNWYYDSYDGCDMGSVETITGLHASDPEWQFEYDEDDEEYEDQNDFHDAMFDNRVIVATGEHMYNDFFEDSSYSYYYCAKSTDYVSDVRGISIAGPCTCMCCGDDSTYEFDDHGDKICSACKERYADSEGVLHPFEPLYDVELEDYENVRVTEESIKDMLWWRPKTLTFVRKDCGSERKAYVIECDDKIEDIDINAYTHKNAHEYIEAYMNEHNITFAEFDRHVAGLIFEHEDCIFRTMYIGHIGTCFLVHDLAEFRKVYEEYMKVEEVDLSDEVQYSRTVLV